MQLPGLCRGVLLFVSGSQNERGEMRMRALMMVLGIFERDSPLIVSLLQLCGSVSLCRNSLSGLKVHLAI